MSDIFLKLRIAYNRWYLGQMKRSALSNTVARNLNEHVIEQRNLIKVLEERMNESNKARK